MSVDGYKIDCNNKAVIQFDIIKCWILFCNILIDTVISSVIEVILVNYSELWL